VWKSLGTAHKVDTSKYKDVDSTLTITGDGVCWIQEEASHFSNGPYKCECPYMTRIPRTHGMKWISSGP
jgi:hypothetical protein